MEQLTALYWEAEGRGIGVCGYRLPQTGSLCVQDEAGGCWIAMDEEALETQAERSVHLAHELGHCVTGSFYNRHAACDLRQKHENRANRWAIRRLIDPERLYDALAAGITDVWELAEHFSVTEAFMRSALAYYRPKAK